jgi:Ca-activated chloride channel family protein
MNVRRVGFPLSLPLICATACLAADQPPPAQFRADANVVLINATVLDRNSRPVRGLSRDCFRLFEGQTEQTIEYFGEDETPLSLAIVLDTSGSMNGKIAGARKVLSAVLEMSNVEDEFSLITFAERPEVVVPWTADAGEIQNRVLMTAPRGRTSLLDAVHLGLNGMRRAKNPRRAIVILSDGGDNYSRYSETQLSRVLEEANVQIYAVEMMDAPLLHDLTEEEMAGPDLLRRLCDRAGGQYFQVSSGSELKTVADQIAKELRSQYLLEYVPSSGARDGRLHHVQLKVQPPVGTRKLSVYWRRGYRAPEE